MSEYPTKKSKLAKSKQSSMKRCELLQRHCVFIDAAICDELLKRDKSLVRCPQAQVSFDCHWFELINKVPMIWENGRYGGRRGAKANWADNEHRAGSRSPSGALFASATLVVVVHIAWLSEVISCVRANHRTCNILAIIKQIWQIPSGHNTVVALE